MAESKIVTAVGVAASSAKGGRPLAQAIEQAMADAVRECAAVGISTNEENAPVIRERMQAARQRVIDAFEAAERQAGR